jgi:hypothetical protein
MACGLLGEVGLPAALPWFLPAAGLGPLSGLMGLGGGSVPFLGPTA